MVDDNWVKQPEDETLVALKRLRLAVLHHGITEGDEEAWLATFTELMDACKHAETAIANAEAR